jgi:hypothetical protein
MENRSFPLTASGQPCRAGVPFETHMLPCCAEPASHILVQLTSPQADDQHNLTTLNSLPKKARATLPPATRPFGLPPRATGAHDESIQAVCRLAARVSLRCLSHRTPRRPHHRHSRLYGLQTGFVDTNIGFGNALNATHTVTTPGACRCDGHSARRPGDTWSARTLPCRRLPMLCSPR